MIQSSSASPLRPTPEQVTLSNTSHFSKLPILPTFDWNSVLKSLDLYFRERQVKITQTVAQLRGVAADDDIIKTMMENEETKIFAD